MTKYDAVAQVARKAAESMKDFREAVTQEESADELVERLGRRGADLWQSQWRELCNEAANCIEAQAREIARLREALRLRAMENSFLAIRLGNARAALEKK